MPFLSIASSLLGNQWARLGMAAILAFGIGWVKGWNAYPRVDVPAIVRNAQEGRDAYWQAKLNAAERDSEAKLAEAIAERDRADAPDIDVAGLCDSDAACTDRGRK